MKRFFCFCGETATRQPDLGSSHAHDSSERSRGLNDYWTRLYFPKWESWYTSKEIHQKLGILLERYFIDHLKVNALPNGRSWADLAGETLAQTGLGKNYPTLFSALRDLTSNEPFKLVL